MKKKSINRVLTALTVIALCFSNYATYYTHAEEPDDRFECESEEEYENNKDVEETIAIDKDIIVESADDSEDDVNNASDMETFEDEIDLAGSGTESDPYILTTAQQVNAIRNNLTAHYLIANDIDMSVINNWEPIGSMDTPFRGVINGQGHALKNLRISYTGSFEKVEEKFYSFIACMVNGKVEKLGIENASYNVKYEHFYGDEYPFSHVAGIVGRMDSSTLSECYFTGTIENNVGNKIYARSGALVSVAKNSSLIKNCYSTSNTSAHSYANNTMVSGGACWLEDDTTIENTYVMGDLSTSSDYGYKYIAGVAASGEGGYTKNCLSLLDSISVSGENVVKDDIANFATKSNCFCYAKDSKEAKNVETYKNLGWDFDGIWMFSSLNNRPELYVFILSGEWYEVYEYSLNETNRTITLTGYNGKDTAIVIPGKAIINGKEYGVIESIKSYYGQIYDEKIGTYNTHDFKNVKSIKLEKGVRLPDDCSDLFAYCYNLTKLDLTELDTSNVTDMESMFSMCKSLESIDLSSFDTSNVTSMHCLFQGSSKLKNVDLSSFNTSNVNDMCGLFYGCENLERANIIGIDTSKVEDMSQMFSGCEKIKSIDLRTIDTSKVTNMAYMFEACISLENLDVSSFDTANVVTMSAMFSACRRLKSLDLSHFNTSKAVDMCGMFSQCSAITTLDLSAFDTRNAVSLHHMFYQCESLREIDLSSFEYYGSEMAYSELYEFFTDDISLEYIKTPKYIDPKFPADLPVNMYELIDGKTRGNTAYTDLVKAPSNAVLVSEKYELPIIDDNELSLENLRYSFDNTAKSFGYPKDYKIPLDSYIYLFGDNTKARYLFKRQTPWRGNCMGFSGTSALLFDADNGLYATTFSEEAKMISDLTPTLSSNELGIDVTKFIEVMQISQNAEQIASYLNNNRIYTYNLESGKRNLNTIYEYIEKSCEKNEPVLLAISQANSGHALLAYDTENVSGSESRIYIYDSNRPEEEVYVTLGKNANGDIVSWRYDMGRYGLWGTDYYSNISYVPYTALNEVWNLRGKLIEGKNTASFNSQDLSIYDVEDNLVATVTNGILNTNNSEIYMMFEDLSLDDVPEDDMITLVMPVDVYTIKNNNEELENFHFEVVDTMQGLTVDTTADEVVMVVSDEYGLNSVQLAASADDSYSISLDSSIEEDISSVLITGMGSLNGEMVEISQNAGEVSVGNGVITSMLYDGEEMITCTISANAGQGGTIDPIGVKTVVKGKDQLYTITADEGYEIADVLVDGVSVGVVSEYLFQAVDKDHSIEARFFKNDMHVVVGEKQTIKLVKGQNAVKEWIADNESIVKLSAKQKRSCKVTGLAEGVVCITGLDKNKEIVVQRYIRIEKPVLSDQVIRSGEEFSVGTFITGIRDCRPTKYSSSKSSVLKIDKKTGTASAKKNGTAKVTVWYGNAKYTAVFEVKMPVISEKKATVKMGETKTLEVANALDEATYRWESSKESIVTVSEEGVLTPVKKGKAKITMYYTVNGKEYIGSSCTVTIKK